MVLVSLEAFVGLYLVNNEIVSVILHQRTLAAFLLYGVLAHMIIFVPMIVQEKKIWRRYYRKIGKKPRGLWRSLLKD
jgi:hypothetical protein